MSEPDQRIALQSWCLRAWREPDEVIARVLDLGVGNLELCGFHVDPDAPDAEQRLDRYLAAGLRITAFGVHTFTGKRDRDQRAIDLARRAQAPVISADFAPGAAQVALDLAQAAGIRLGVHNHGRRHRYGSAAALTQFMGETQGIGLYLDTAWMLDSGEDPVAIAREHYARLVGLHLKDFIFDRAGRPADVVVGTGNLDLDGLACLLVQRAWQGSLTIEYEGDVQQPLPALRRCLEAAQTAFAKARLIHQGARA